MLNLQPQLEFTENAVNAWLFLQPHHWPHTAPGCYNQQVHGLLTLRLLCTERSQIWQVAPMDK